MFFSKLKIKTKSSRNITRALKRSVPKKVQAIWLLFKGTMKSGFCR